MIRQGTWIEINTSLLKQNFNTLQEYLTKTSPGVEMMPIVKANAYGHGLQECSDLFVEQGISRLGVACLNEAYELRAFGSAPVRKASILVLTPPLKKEAEWFCQLKAEFLAMDIEVLKELSSRAVLNNIHLYGHLYIDTGMKWNGIEPEAALSFMQECEKLPNIQIIGLCTHFATADDVAQDFTISQLQKFLQVRRQLQKAGFSFRYVHAANSGAILQFPESHFSVVRPGLLLYGYIPNKNLSHIVKVSPVLSLKARIISLRRVSAGESVGYGRQYYAQKDTTIATIPIGYGDGLSRRYSEKFACLIRGKQYSGVGFICMDHSMVAIGDDRVEIGDEVVLVGSQGERSIDAHDLAIGGGTISREILSTLSSRIPRVFVNSIGI